MRCFLTILLTFLLFCVFYLLFLSKTATIRTFSQPNINFIPIANLLSTFSVAFVINFMFWVIAGTRKMILSGLTATYLKLLMPRWGQQCVYFPFLLILSANIQQISTKSELASLINFFFSLRFTRKQSAFSYQLHDKSMTLYYLMNLQVNKASFELI